MVAESLDQLLSPHDLDAERSVLEAVMVEPGRLTKATAILTPADFFRAAHGDIFAAMIAVAERTGDGIDAITVCAELTQRGLLDEAGGAAYIGSLMSGVPRGVNLPHYADIVLRHSITRRTLYDLRLAMFQIAREGASGDALDLVEVTAQRARHAADAVEDDDQLFVTAADTCQDQESVPMALEPYLPAGSIGSVVAKVKEGKTTIILEMVRCIRHGDGFAGFKAPPAHDRVLYATEQLRASFTKQLKDAGLATDLGVVVSYLSKWRGRPWSEVGPALIRKAGQEEPRSLSSTLRAAGLASGRMRRTRAAVPSMSKCCRASVTKAAPFSWRGMGARLAAMSATPAGEAQPSTAPLTSSSNWSSPVLILASGKSGPKGASRCRKR